MSFNQIEYINRYSKENYKTLLLKYRKNSAIFDWINNKNNKNGYVIKLIENDIKNNINDIYHLISIIKKDNNNKKIYFGDWLDEFYRNPKSLKQLMIEREPIYNKEDPVFMSYIASSVEYLANKNKLDKPAWINDNKYVYDGTYYAGNTKIIDYQKYLKDNSPIEFSKRNLYVGDNILKRF